MYMLSDSEIARAWEGAETFLCSNKIDHAEVIRLRLILEEILLNYRNRFGTDCQFSLKTVKVLGKPKITVQLTGESFNPFSSDESGETELLGRLRRLSDSTSSWSYKNGVNYISLIPKRKIKLSTTAKTIIAFFLAIIAGLLCRNLDDSTKGELLTSYITPTLNMIMGVITAISGPMIFFSLLWGICTIGDINTLSKIGKRMIGRFMFILLLVSAFSALFCYPLFGGSNAGSTSFNFAEFYANLLNVIPDNMISPFITGNTQQIIFLAAVGGIILLIMGSRVSALTTVIEHLTLMTQAIMTLACVLIPVMVFLSIYKVILSDQLSNISNAYKVIPIYIGLSLLILFVYTMIVVVTQKVNPITVFKKVSQPFLIALTTGSSPTALSANLESCEKKFGISGKIVSFGVPLGQTIFKPGSLSRFVVVSFCMAELYDVAITPNWVFITILTCFLLGVSSPPVAGGAVVCFAVLFRQLGIPEEAIGFALAINILFDFILTAVNIYCLDMELIRLSSSLKMLNKKVLRDKESGI